MGDFRRQPSKVWWSTFSEGTPSFPDWGAGVDLSGNAGKNTSIDGVHFAARVNISKMEERETDSQSLAKEESSDGNEATAEKYDWEERKNDPNWRNSDVSSDRGCSSSPSQGSHKSQDSGFSDSEIQSNAVLHSPQDSPELSKREETPDANGSLISQFQNVHISKNHKSPCCGRDQTKPNYLETAFDGPSKCEVESGPKSSYQKNVSCEGSQSILTKVQKLRTKNSDKINKIQNQLELSFKFPSARRPVSGILAHIPKTSEDKDKSFHDPNSSNHTVIELPKKPERSESDTDGDGFKIPKTLADQNVNYKGSDNFLNLTHIEGPPVSSSTPKSTKLKRQQSPIPRAARAIEKKIGGMTTFATIRKLKGISDKKMRRPISLFPSFNRSKIREATPQKSKKPPEGCRSSIRQWLSELGTMYEAEIMTTLQSKSLATDLTRQVTNMAAATSETVRRLHQKTRIISAEFSKVFQHKINKNYNQITPLVYSLISHIKEFVTDYIQSQELIPITTERVVHHRDEDSKEMVTDFRQEEPKTKEVGDSDLCCGEGAEVLKACEDLRQTIENNITDEGLVEENLTNLGEKFTKVVDTILLAHVKALVHALEEPKTELALRTALSALMSLDLEGNLISHLVARSEGVRALLAVCLEARATEVRVMALRALTIVCCVGETIRQFEQAGGLEIASDILADDKRSEAELSEAVAVLVQITAPWIKENHSFQSLSRFLGDLVKSLTSIVRICKSSETLLLSAAALANLTFMEPRTVWPLLENQTAKILLAAVRRQGPKVSVFIQEQAATVIANMASVPECRKHLAENRAVVALLCFLQIRHSPCQRLPEIAAAERVQQKSAIALSRLCSDSVVAKQVVELQGVMRLVRLCKEEGERNHSDGVLVACLAALRKIVANCGTEALENLEAMELVEPRLLDSFLLYSSKQESYV